MLIIQVQSRENLFTLLFLIYYAPAVKDSKLHLLN